ncbi:MAG: hypothetical protein ACTH5D_03240 [Halomonas sp.]|uniref:hypothetical protein n=1 Tax=Halomonas sp. TaxID=1486246 RepID=UPI003F8F4FAF
MDDDHIKNKPVSEGRRRFLIGSANTGAAALLLGGGGLAMAKTEVIPPSDSVQQDIRSQN